MPTLAQQMKEEFLETYGPQLVDKGKQEGIVEGIKIGRVKGIETTAKNMLRKGIDLNIIADSTGLPMKKINQMAIHIQRESHLNVSVVSKFIVASAEGKYSHGGEIMPALAQQMKEEFLEIYGPQLIDKGKQEGIETTAKNMLRKGIDLNIIADSTGLPMKKIKQMALHINRKSHLKVSVGSKFIVATIKGKYSCGDVFMSMLTQKMNEEFLETYGPQLIDKGKQEGIVEGIKIGTVKGIETTAKNLIRKGIDMNIIVDITGLPVEKIKQMALHINRKSH